MALSRYSSPSPQRAAVGVRFTDAERYFVSEASVYADAKHKLIRKPSIALAETDCLAGHIGFEPPNPAAGYLIGFA